MSPNGFANTAAVVATAAMDAIVTTTGEARQVVADHLWQWQRLKDCDALAVDYFVPRDDRVLLFVLRSCRDHVSCRTRQFRGYVWSGLIARGRVGGRLIAKVSRLFFWIDSWRLRPAAILPACRG